jgi:DNA-binding PadR family transcriptional regulator
MPIASSSPIKPLIFQILVALSEGERHGWDLVREIRQRTGGERVLPANFYRTLRAMLADDLIEEASRRRADRDAATDERRRYFKLTASGVDAARTEARRLQALLADARTRRLLKTPSSVAARKA